MLADSEGSLIDWRHFDKELLSYYEEVARRGDLTGCQQWQLQLSQLHASLSFTLTWDLRNYTNAHAFTAVRSEAQSTIVLCTRKIVLRPITLPRIFFAIRVYIIIIIVIAYYFLRDPCIYILPSINFPRDLRICTITCPANLLCDPRV